MSESISNAKQPGGIRNWIINHDDSWLFIIGYIGLAVVLSIWISLFWLVAVVAVHFLFEIVRQHTIHDSWTTIISESLWELKLDIALVLFALVVSLYMDVVLGVAGLQGAARAGASAAQGGDSINVSIIHYQTISLILRDLLKIGLKKRTCTLDTLI